MSVCLPILYFRHVLMSVCITRSVCRYLYFRYVCLPAWRIVCRSCTSGTYVCLHDGLSACTNVRVPYPCTRLWMPSYPPLSKYALTIWFCRFFSFCVNIKKTPKVTDYRISATSLLWRASHIAYLCESFVESAIPQGIQTFSPSIKYLIIDPH